MMHTREAIGQIYAQVRAPEWAAPNLDGLADVLRDASWLPVGPVEVRVPAGLGGSERRRLSAVLAQVAADTQDTARPVRVIS